MPGGQAVTSLLSPPRPSSPSTFTRLKMTHGGAWHVCRQQARITPVNYVPGHCSDQHGVCADVKAAPVVAVEETAAPEVHVKVRRSKSSKSSADESTADKAARRSSRKAGELANLKEVRSQEDASVTSSLSRTWDIRCSEHKI